MKLGPYQGRDSTRLRILLRLEQVLRRYKEESIDEEKI